MQAAIYARLSVTSEESVSIERQLASCRDYARARGYEVVLEATDDGVSASTNKPQHRVGWRKLLDSPKHYDVALVWKTDRLARNTLDFLTANEDLNNRGAAIVTVEDHIDMTSPEGKAFATILAVFAEMEANAISSRVRAAHKQLKLDGRIPSGRVPYGYLSIPNPDGPGKVRAIDPDTIPFVIEAVRRAANGDSLYSIAKYMTDAGAPRRANKLRKLDVWSNTSVEGFLNSPTLAGMTAYSPGRPHGDFSVPDVLRRDDGMPIVDESIAIMTPAEWFAMHEVMERRKFPGRSTIPDNPSILFGIAMCAKCKQRMKRSGKNGMYLRCAFENCERPRPTVDRGHLERYVIGEAVKHLGHLEVFEQTIDADADALKRADIERMIQDTVQRMAVEDNMEALTERLASLKTLRKTVEHAEPTRSQMSTGKTFKQIMSDGTFEQRRQALMAVVKTLEVRNGNRGYRTMQTDRITLEWNFTPESVATATQMSIDQFVWTNTTATGVTVDRVGQDQP